MINSKKEASIPSNAERSAAIVAFLRCHPLISRNALCKIAGYDVSNLAKIINGNGPYVAISANSIPKFEAILKQYGF